MLVGWHRKYLNTYLINIWLYFNRKGGSNKLIKIYHRNGKYGFVETQMTFNSVIELVTFYRHNSLSRYNNSLDITLKHPVKVITTP